jgi:Domain of unknown function (DUF4383)
MARNVTRLQKVAWGFAAMFLGVYLLDYVPGIIADNGKMFGLFSITTIVDIGHLAMGVLAAIAAWHSAKAARIYFWVLGIWYSIDVIVYFFSHLQTISLIVNILVNMPHTLITIAAYTIALKLDRQEPARIHAVQSHP